MNYILLSEEAQIQLVHDKLRNITNEQKRIRQQYFKSNIIKNEEKQISFQKGLNNNQEEKSQGMIKFSKNIPEEQSNSKEIILQNQDPLSTDQNQNTQSKLQKQLDLNREISEIEQFNIDVEENLKVMKQQVEKSQENFINQIIEQDVQESNFTKLLSIKFDFDNLMKAISIEDPENQQEIKIISNKLKKYQFNELISPFERFQGLKKDLQINDNSLLEPLFYKIDDIIRKQYLLKNYDNQKKKNLAEKLVNQIQSKYPSEPQIMLCIFLLSKQYFQLQNAFLNDLNLYQSRINNELILSQKC